VDPSINLPPLNVPGLLRAYHLHPKKGLGQNFLVDEVALQQVVDAADLVSDSTVLEIGAGLGSLTRRLALVARQVTAVEIDKDLFPILRLVLASFSNVHLEAGDILEMDATTLVGEAGYVVAANIPYYITSALIRRLLEAPLKPSRVVLTVQKEVAMRICARPNEMSLLALGVQVYGQPRILASIPAGAFYPAPEVDSSVVRVDLFPQPFIPSANLDLFFRLARAGFGQKRKQLRNSLSGVVPGGSAGAVSLLQSAGIDPQRRAETLSLAEWAELTGFIQALNR
jgi:16S rRNA (adenine1518-N6/adenine1519-N6)-dimethyltransferase